MTAAGVELLTERLRAARHITILTGAGVSAASGVPTFRGAGGLWRNFRAGDLATPEAFARDPRLVWEWYAWRRELIAACRPNAAHGVIARWSRFSAVMAAAIDRLPGHGPRAKRGPGAIDGGRGVEGRPGAMEGSAEGRRHVRVITQNVDDLHLRAGTHDLVRLHGSIWELRCDGGGSQDTGAATRPPGPCGAAWRDERVPLPELPPRCPSCGGVARPGVVWFGESLAADTVAAAARACECDVFLTVGTSAIVYPAAGLAHEAHRRGAFTAEINVEPTPASSAVDLVIRGAAEDVLPRLDGAMSGGR